jgi:hypothetical protein
MKPHDPKDIAGDIFSTKELLETFSGASHPNDDFHTDLLRQMSGNYDNYKVFGAARESDPDSNENRDRRSNDQTQRLAMNAARWRNMDLFKLAGIGFSFEQIIDSFSHAKDSLKERIAEKEEEIKASETQEKDGVCRIDEKPLDGKFMYKNGLSQGFGAATLYIPEEGVIPTEGPREETMTQEEVADLQETLSTLYYYADQIETGQMHPNDLPDEIKQLLVDAREEILGQELENGATVSYDEPSPVDAKFQDVFTVVPGLTPELKP